MKKKTVTYAKKKKKRTYEHTVMSYSARRLALQGQCWDWLVRCQYAVSE